MNKKPLITAICIMSIITGMLSGCGAPKDQNAAVASQPAVSVQTSDASQGAQQGQPTQPAQPTQTQKQKIEGKIKMDFIQTPQQLMVYTRDTIDKLDAAKVELGKLLKKQEDGQTLTPEEVARREELKSNSADILAKTKKVEDKALLKEIFDEIRKLEGDKVEITEDNNAAKTLLFSFMLVDDAEKGIAGNSEAGYLRYMAVLKDNYIIVPKKTDDGKQGYYAKVKISDSLFQKLEALTK